MKGAKRFSTYLNDELKHKGFQQAFDAEDIYANLAIQIAKLRQESGYTQKDLARVLHTTQQTVSRLEVTNNRSLSLNTLLKLASAFHKKIKIQFV
ncbi:MAG: helix-turn-helix transcriptional regulator [Candidatus Omnitrophota bacterium]